MVSTEAFCLQSDLRADVQGPEQDAGCVERCLAQRTQQVLGEMQHAQINGHDHHGVVDRV